MTHISSERIASIESRRHELAEAMARANLSPDEFVKLSKDYAAIEPIAASVSLDAASTPIQLLSIQRLVLPLRL